MPPPKRSFESNEKILSERLSMKFTSFYILPRLRVRHSYATMREAGIQKGTVSFMKKAVIFDLDGTLINSLPDIAHSMNRALEKCGLPIFSVEEYRYKVGNGVFNLAKRAVGDRMDKLDEVLKLYMDDYAANCALESTLYDGIEDLFAGLSLRHMKVCVFSNKDQGDVESVLSHYFANYPFAKIRGRVQNVPLKPDPAGALLIAGELGLSPDECWYVGDTLMDMCCGNAARMETVGVTWGFRPRTELVENNACHIIDHPSELLALIDEQK